MRTRAAFATLLAAIATAALLAQDGNALSIYVIDVEGGNATLFVPPDGDSVLIDTGNPGAFAARDADRIMAAVKDAGIKQIDHLITTHWHGDHFGGMAELADRIPIAHFVDHGPTVQKPTPADDAFFAKVYPELYGKVRRSIVRAGEALEVDGLDWRIVSAAGAVLPKPLRGAGGANAACAASPAKDADPTENAQSVGSVVTFGQFRVAHLGDLTWNKELDLMCPANKIGTVDLLVVSHHGQPTSNSPALVHALRPRAGIINNGTRKGGQPEAMRVLHSSPGLEDLWQIHFSLLSGQEHTVPGLFIANLIDQQPETMPIAAMAPPAAGSGAPPPPVHNGPAYWIKVSAQRNGSFNVTNQRNGFAKTYRRDTVGR
jgi:competence protein ComEC